MCRYSTLCHSTSGYLIQCADCRHFQFAFGTFELCMSSSELELLYAELSSQIFPRENDEIHRKSVRIRLEKSVVTLALSPYETKEMMKMIDEAYATLALKELLADY